MGDQMEYRMEQIVWRAEKIRKRRDRKLFVGLSSVSFLLAVSLVGAIGATIDGMQTESLLLGTYGAVLLHQGGDAYVLTGILAFTAGVIITALCIRAHKKQRSNELTVQKYEEEAK